MGAGLSGIHLRKLTLAQQVIQGDNSEIPVVISNEVLGELTNIRLTYYKFSDTNGINVSQEVDVGTAVPLVMRTALGANHPVPVLAGNVRQDGIQPPDGYDGSPIAVDVLFDIPATATQPAVTDQRTYCLDSFWSVAQAAGADLTEFDTLADLLAFPNPVDGEEYDTLGHTVKGDKGAARLICVTGQPAGWTADQDLGYWQSTGDATKWFHLRSETVTPFHFGAVGNAEGINNVLQAGATNDGLAIRAWEQYCFDVRADKAEWIGSFRDAEATPLNIRGGATTHYNLACDLYVDAARDDMINLTDCQFKIAKQYLKVVGVGGSSLASRQNVNGIVLKNCSRLETETLTAYHAQEWALVIDGEGVNNSTMVDINRVEARFCGTQNVDAATSITATYSNVVTTGSGASTAQRTTIDVDVLPPNNEYSRQQLTVLINGLAYHVYTVNDGGSQLEIYPALPVVDTGGTLNYIVGGAVTMIGNDAGNITIRSIDATNCGIGCNITALYGPSILAIQAQSCGIGVSLGSRPEGAMEGGFIGRIHAEANTADLLVRNRSTKDFTIASFRPLDTAKVLDCADARDATRPFSFSGIRPNGIIFDRPPENFLASGTTVDGVFPRNNVFPIVGNTKIINLEWDAGANKMAGYEWIELVGRGTGPAHNPTGTWTINPPAGWTIDGAANLVLTRQMLPIWRHLYFDIAGTNVETTNFNNPTHEYLQSTTSSQTRTLMDQAHSVAGDIMEVRGTIVAKGTGANTEWGIYDVYATWESTGAAAVLGDNEIQLISRSAGFDALGVPLPIADVTGNRGRFRCTGVVGNPFDWKSKLMAPEYK